MAEVQSEAARASDCSKSLGAAFHGDAVSSCTVVLGAVVYDV